MKSQFQDKGMPPQNFQKSPWPARSTNHREVLDHHEEYLLLDRRHGTMRLETMPVVKTCVSETSMSRKTFFRPLSSMHHLRTRGNIFNNVPVRAIFKVNNPAQVSTDINGTHGSVHTFA
jgi:hypothetical protein